MKVTFFTWLHNFGRWLRWEWDELRAEPWQFWALLLLHLLLVLLIWYFWTC